DASEVVFSALVTGGSPSSVTPGSSLGVPYTPRAQTGNGSAYEEDITSSAAGGQQGTATLASATDWYAVCAVFHPLPATPPGAPSTPTGLETTSVASTRVALSWLPSNGSVAGYTVYRDDSAIGTTGPDATTFLDPDVAPSITHTYSVDAFDLANDHSARSAALTVTTPAESPEFIQGAAASTANRLPSYTLNLTEPVASGDLVVAAVLTAGQPAWATPGSSQRVPFVLDVQNGSASSDLEDILSAADGAQQASLTLGRATNWYMVLATFFPPTTANPTTTTT